MGDLRAADRVRARGRDPAEADLPARPPVPANRPARRAGRRRHGSPVARPARVLRPLRPARDHAAAGGARGGVRGTRRPRTTPTTSAGGGDCGRFRGSGAGRSRSSRSAARAGSIRSRPATSPTSSWSGGCCTGATHARARPRRRSRRSSRPTRRGRGCRRLRAAQLEGRPSPSGRSRAPWPAPRRCRSGPFEAPSLALTVTRLVRERPRREAAVGSELEVARAGGGRDRPRRARRPVQAQREREEVPGPDQIAVARRCGRAPRIQRGSRARARSCGWCR